MAKVTIDGVEHDSENLSDLAQSTIRSLQFVEEGLLQRRNELAVADTARSAYLAALKSALKQQKSAD